MVVQKILWDGRVPWNSIIPGASYANRLKNYVYERGDGEYTLYCTLSHDSAHTGYFIFDKATGKSTRVVHFNDAQDSDTGIVDVYSRYGVYGHRPFIHRNEYGKQLFSGEAEDVGDPLYYNSIKYVCMESIEGATMDSDGNYVVLGECGLKDELCCFYVLKYDSSGKCLRTALNATAELERNFFPLHYADITCTSDGGYLAVWSGFDEYHSNVKHPNLEFLVAKYKKNLDCEYVKALRSGECHYYKEPARVQISNLPNQKYLIHGRTSYVIDERGNICNAFNGYKGEDDSAADSVIHSFNAAQGRYVCASSHHIICIAKKGLSSVPDADVRDLDPKIEYQIHDGGESAESSGEEVDHLYKNYTRTEKIRTNSISVYANGTAKYKTYTLFTDILASYQYSKDKKGKLKTAAGKVIAGITSSNEKPVLQKGKIVDADAAKKASVSIKNGQVTIKAKSQAGTVYLWVMDTGDNGVYTSCPVTIKAAPTVLAIYNTADAVYGETEKYTKAQINRRDTTDIYVAAVYKDGDSYKDVNDLTYTVTMKRITAVYDKKKKIITVTAAKDVLYGTKAYFLLVYNDKAYISFFVKKED